MYSAEIQAEKNGMRPFRQMAAKKPEAICKKKAQPNAAPFNAQWRERM